MIKYYTAVDKEISEDDFSFFVNNVPIYLTDSLIEIFPNRNITMQKTEILRKPYRMVSSPPAVL